MDVGDGEGPAFDWTLVRNAHLAMRQEEKVSIRRIHPSGSKSAAQGIRFSHLLSEALFIYLEPFQLPHNLNNQSAADEEWDRWDDGLTEVVVGTAAARPTSVEDHIRAYRNVTYHDNIFVEIVSFQLNLSKNSMV